MEKTYLIFGGNYGNLEATKALYAKAKELQIPDQNIICTGDMIAYCADVNEVATLVKDWDINVIQGNCEESIAKNSDDCGCGFSKETSCDILSKKWYQYCKKTISDENKKWFSNLPKTLEIKYNGLKILVCHGSPNNINHFVFHSELESNWKKLFAEMEADIILSGHCGIPFTRINNNKVWHNSGALGMPANDGTPRVWYSVMKILAKNVTFEHYGLEYNYIKTMQTMQQNNLPKEYIEALKSGLWPSLDILPEVEKNQTNKALKENMYVWKRP